MGRVCHGPSLYGPSLLWAEFVMGRVCYGPSCPVTIKLYPCMDLLFLQMYFSPNQLTKKVKNLSLKLLIPFR